MTFEYRVLEKVCVNLCLKNSPVNIANELFRIFRHPRKFHVRRGSSQKDFLSK